MSFCVVPHRASTASWLSAYKWHVLVCCRSTSGSSSSHSASRSRGHVTSPSLCRHAIDRLGPILQQHRGCNLIDLRPAGGPWSDHLVDALQPKIHVQVGTPAPTTSSSPLRRHAASLRDCFDPGRQLLSPQLLAAPNRGYTQPNDDLVIAANLSGAAMSTSRFLGSPASYFLNDLYAALFGLRDNLFRHGLVRVVAWLPDPVVRALVPRGVESRSKQSIKLEAAFSIIQVAGTVRGTVANPDRRWYGLEAENYRLVQAEAEARQTPASRIDVAPLPMLTSLPPDPTLLRTAKYTSGATFVQDWLLLDAELRSKYPDWFARRAYQSHPPRSGPLEDRQLNQWRKYLTRTKTLHNRHHKIAAVVEMQRAVDAQYRLLANQSPLHAAHTDRSLDKVHDEAAKARAAMLSLSREGQIQAKKAIDDYRAYDSSPRALEWNKRILDPLVVQAGEFQPKHPLALVVLTPRPSFRTALDTDSKVTCFDYIVNRLSSRLSSSVLEALQTFIHGPIQDFIDTVPSLTDPVKGGCVDLSDLRVRSLPGATFVDIAVAFEKWPLRPHTAKMMLDMSRESTFIAEHED